MADFTIANLANAAVSWTPSTSGSKKDERRTRITKTFENTIQGIMHLQADTASLVLNIVPQLVMNASNATRDPSSVVIRTAALVLSNSESSSDGEGSLAALGGNALLQIAPFVFPNASVAPHDAAAVRIVALRAASILVDLLDADIAAAFIAAHGSFAATLEADLGDLRSRQQFSKRTFSQTKGAQEQEYEDVAAIRVALVGLIGSLWRKGVTAIPTSLPHILAEPGYKPRDVLVYRSVLSLLAEATDRDLVMSVVTVLPNSSNVIYKCSQAPSKQEAKLLWQEQQQGLPPLHDTAAAICVGNSALHAAECCSSSDETAAVAAVIGSIVRHPEVRVFSAIAARVATTLTEKTLGALLLQRPEGASEAVGAFLVNRLVGQLSSPSPHEVGSALEQLSSLATRLHEGWAGLSAGAKAPTHPLSPLKEATISAAVPWFSGFREALQNVIERDHIAASGGTAGRVGLLTAVRAWYRVLALRTRAGVATPDEVHELTTFLAETGNQRFLAEEIVELIEYIGSRLYADFEAAGGKPSLLRISKALFIEFVIAVVPKLNTQQALRVSGNVYLSKWWNESMELTDLLRWRS